MPKRPRSQYESDDEDDEKHELKTTNSKRHHQQPFNQVPIDQSLFFSRLPLTTKQKNALLKSIYPKEIEKYKNPETYLFCR